MHCKDKVPVYDWDIDSISDVKIYSNQFNLMTPSSDH